MIFVGEITVLNASQIAAATTAQLKQALTQGLTISAKQLAYLALVWHELECRGEDLSALKSGLAIYLPLIAEDRLDPEVVVRFAGQKTLLAALMSLPIDRQRALLVDDTVPVVTIGDEDERLVSRAPLLQLSAMQVRQVIHDGKLCSEDEQYRRLLSQKPGRRRGSIKRRVARKVTVENVDGTTLLSVGGTRVKMDSMVAALAEHHGLSPERLAEFLKKGG